MTAEQLLEIGFKKVKNKYCTYYEKIVSKGAKELIYQTNRCVNEYSKDRIYKIETLIIRTSETYEIHVDDEVTIDNLTKIILK